MIAVLFPSLVQSVADGDDTVLFPSLVQIWTDISPFMTESVVTSNLEIDFYQQVVTK